MNAICTQVHYILAELVMGGMVLETNMTEIITRIEEQNKLEKSEVTQWAMFGIVFAFIAAYSNYSSGQVVECSLWMSLN